MDEWTNFNIKLFNKKTNNKNSFYFLIMDDVKPNDIILIYLQYVGPGLQIKEYNVTNQKNHQLG